MTAPAQIRIGTLVKARDDAPGMIRELLPHGFESFSLVFGRTVLGIDLPKLADDIRTALDGSAATISSLGVYGNALDPAADYQADTVAAFESLIDHAHRFGCDIVGGFTGRMIDQPVAESLPRFVEVFTPLAGRAESAGVRIAFENCTMGGDALRGDWNIAHNPACWEMLFSALNRDCMGLQWEPAHQICQGLDPIAQLRTWAPRVFHVHGKDANAATGEHRFPGLGDSDWVDIFAILGDSGYCGAIDIEGWHDPIWRDETEIPGQVNALNDLKRCRNGE